MKQIFIHSTAGSNNQMFDRNGRDSYNDPYIYLRERLSNLGYKLMTTDSNSLKDCAWIFFNDIVSAFPYKGLRGNARRLIKQSLGKPVFRDLYSECVESSFEEKMALFLWEAQAFSPDNWDTYYHKHFPVIFTWNDSIVDDRKYFKIFCPQPRIFPSIPDVPFVDKKLLVNISSNKFSNHPRELYSARREAISYFEQSHPNDFDLYGVGWDQPARYVERIFPFGRKKYQSYRGTVRHKWDVFPFYRFSVCYENIRDETGYLTEKIFDSMRACCVPIYWGAPNITDYVDKDAFIDRRKFKTNEELNNYLVGISEQEYNSYQTAIQDYLNSARFAKFLPYNFADTIINTLEL